MDTVSMNPNLFATWLRSETENGSACGQAEALHGNAQKTDMSYAMPCGIQAKFSAEQWEQLHAARLEAYRMGFASVTRFSLTAYSKKAAEDCVRSLVANGHSVLNTEAAKNERGVKVWTVNAATSKRF